MKRTLASVGVVACTAVFASGCNGSTAEGEIGDFVADNPFGGGGDDGAGDTGAAGEDGGDDNGGDPGREIAEADIVHIEGDRLYALSQYGGLAVIDVANPDDMEILGRYRAHAAPFEMYIDGGQVFVMYTDFGRYGWDEDAGGYQWQTSSKLVALDATTPSEIVSTGEFDMPGRIQDSRRVGDVLYLVTHEDGYCWGCDSERNTTVSSLDVSNPQKVELVDRLRFTGDDETDAWGWDGQRSVSATDEHMYIAGMEFGGDWEQGHSVIDVVDISDPGGSLLRGAAVPVAGQVSNRWQMDEFEGVLRVVSQPGFWGGSEPPVVETFAVASADDIEPLGSLTMSLPRPEDLRAVRFDGPRGYAITFERVDPLFTLDLSDPGSPAQIGELEIPGWVHHMEPRGDRLLGLGFDPDHPDGAINVSLFDVADLNNPTMLSRVHFGGDWASFAEDQNRIHKAFTILEELQLLAVPFSGWEYNDDDDYGCYGRYNSAVQLIDWADDTLTRRGQAPAHGVARRALVHNDRLLAMSDKVVESFDITDRDQPVSTSEVALAKNVTQLGVGEDRVVRLSRDWWSDETLLDVVARGDETSPDALGQLNLNTVLQGEDTPEGCWHWGLWNAELLVHGQHAYLVREQWDAEYDNAAMHVDVFDLTDPTAPTFVQTLDVDAQLGWGGGGIVSVDESRVLKAGDAIVVSARDGYGYGYGYGDEENQGARFIVIDLSDPAAPVVRPPVERPSAVAYGDLQVHGDTLVSWHMKPLPDDPSRVRFYLDRLDVQDPSAPVLAEPVNVPGIVAGYDAPSGRAITVDFQTEVVPADDEQACYDNPKFYGYDYDAKTCLVAHRALKSVHLVEGGAVLLSTVDVEGEAGALRSVAASSTRVFARLSEGSWGWGAVGEGGGGGGPTSVPTDSIAVLEDWTDSALYVSSTTQVGFGSWWLGPVRAAGDRAVFDVDAGLAVLDASDAAAPGLTVHDLIGYGCWGLELLTDQAMCPMGEYGVQTVPLTE